MSLVKFCQMQRPQHLSVSVTVVIQFLCHIAGLQFKKNINNFFVVIFMLFSLYLLFKKKYVTVKYLCINATLIMALNPAIFYYLITSEIFPRSGFNYQPDLTVLSLLSAILWLKLNEKYKLPVGSELKTVILQSSQ